MKDELKGLEQTIDKLCGDDKKKRGELMTLVSRLEKELSHLSETNRDQAKRLAELTTKKARSKGGDDVHNDLHSQLAEFEATHISLVETINAICNSLASLGI